MMASLLPLLLPLIFVAVSGDSSSDCFDREYKDVGGLQGWDSVKWVTPVARCLVQGFPIEELDPEFNFRRGYALGYAPPYRHNEEDRTHLLPFFRANHDASLHERQRRVYIDLGGKTFNSSITWFLRMYPLAFTEMHVFEAVPGLFQIPESSSGQMQDIVPAMSSNGRVKNRRPDDFPKFVLDKVQLHEVFVGLEDKKDPPSINITRFIKNELGLTEKDTVIVKMDIEEEEWAVLPAWLADPQMPKIIDEIFVEIHYKDETMAEFHWMKFSHTKEEATRLLLDLRKGGFFVHPWP